MNRVLIALLATLATACGTDTTPGSRDPAPDLIEGDIGHVSFPVSCQPEAAALVERGVVLLHHMMYENALLAFAMAESLDESCAMAAWGQAMTLIHPLWPDQPSDAELELGRALADRGLSVAGITPRESAYLATVDGYFLNPPGDTETQRLARFASAWAKLADAHPDDLEARAFHALAYLATADLADKSYVKNLGAAALAQSVLDAVPDHPGAHHYLIHAYDNPALAERARPVADRYGALTPVVPHATHMMTHIYTRLGDWRQSIEWNRRSRDSAWALCEAQGEITSHYQHAQDYLAYAHLQLGEDSLARAVMEDIKALEAPFSTVNLVAGAYAQSAIPARYYLERHDWAGAAGLQPRVPASFPWSDEHAPYVAISHFARALGFARGGRPDGAVADLDALATLRDVAARTSPYWAGQVEIQRLSARAWQAFAQGDRDAARTDMRAAVDLETATEKSPVTPGEVLPAAELLGDLLLADRDPAGALAAYEQSLARTPGRLNSLFGAAAAAEQSGAAERAHAYYRQVAEELGPQSERDDMRQAAQRYLAGSSVAAAGSGG